MVKRIDTPPIPHGTVTEPPPSTSGGTTGSPSPAPTTSFLKGGLPVAPGAGGTRLARGVFAPAADPVVDTPAPGITRNGSFDRIAENLQIEDPRAPLSPEARRVLEGSLTE